MKHNNDAVYLLTLLECQASRMLMKGGVVPWGVDRY